MSTLRLVAGAACASDEETAVHGLVALLLPELSSLKLATKPPGVESPLTTTRSLWPSSPAARLDMGRSPSPWLQDMGLEEQSPSSNSLQLRVDEVLASHSSATTH